ncbi:DNA-binding transcriptional regulator, LysR family [Cupriavidus sp. OV038]|jgi:DNA-binding transcriptional LysR family regulator|uniref:LysR family transcriptional regulator n=2 Tax=Burkholderiaceae TaxID=119060 RepID=UPI0008E7FA7C|nr:MULTISPECIES: LysR family transcriptional regulator [unclassified Cupriavidus]SFC39901.1 DNA-binding transcriptional regulator, LysR family [Cupriavidus sp. OV038]SFP29981.1 DNA-binding transcriptional regulator, LysR family [Cupriavidus sp. OV096]
MKATMEIRDLRMFMALAEELHFGRAAERLRISQPPLTKHIQQLEEQLGVMLFDRNKRSVRLTPAGAALVQEARRILNQAEVALQVVRRAQQGETGTLRIGFVAAVVYIGIEALFARLHRELAGVETVWEEMGSSEQVEALRKDRIDLGFAQVPMGVGEMAAHLVASVPLAAALPATHRLAGRAKIDVAALADEPFIVIPRESAPGYFDLTAATCLAGGFSPNFRHYAKHLLSVISLVALGRGVALVPRTLGTAAVPGVVLKPLTGAPAHAQYSAIWHPGNPSPVLARAVELLGAGGLR